jgi:o-succinylbenzoate---CoA ligase
MERAQLASLLGASRPDPGRASLLVAEATPEAFMDAFSRAAASQGNVFLGDHAWGHAERAAVSRLLMQEGREGNGWLMIPSGGSTGSPRFARHDGHTIAAAVGGFRAHFGIERVNCVGVLPLFHVSGFMAWMRARISGGTYLPWSWKDLEAGRVPALGAGEWCISLVPTQLQRIIGFPEAVAWLRGFRVIFIGSGPSWPTLLDEAARLGLPISTGYGSTETAAMAAGLRPDAFLEGARGCGQALAHASIDIDHEGQVSVSGPSIFRGYFPQVSDLGTWRSGDLGRWDERGGLVIEGRRDDIIITGGKKVSPAEVEEALRATGHFDDVAVIGVPDAEWGQAVAAVVVPVKGGYSNVALPHLASYKRPKRLITVAALPRSAQGKINRIELARLATGGA